MQSFLMSEMSNQEIVSLHHLTQDGSENNRSREKI